jgi:nicotinate-nucleotide adenylyltransferase
VESFRPDEFIFIPGYLSPYKSRSRHSPAAERLKMLELAIPALPQASVCKAEIERGGISYTIDTLKLLQERFPQARISWIIGDDHLDRLHEWRDYPRHIEYCDFIVLPRIYQSAELRARIAAHPLNTHLYPLDSEPFPVSSTMIREALAKGGLVSALLPEAVDSYIREQHLYGYPS